MSFLEYIKNSVLVLDGAMGTMIQGLNLTDADFGGPEFRMLSDLLSLSRPDEVKNIHLTYLRSGCHAIETNTFGASPLRLAEFDFSRLDIRGFAAFPQHLEHQKMSHADLSYAISKHSSVLARMAIEEHKRDADYDGRPLFVLGSIGPSNWVLASTNANLRRGSYSQIVDNFAVQVRGLIDGGTDVLLFETQQDPLELKAAIHGAHKAMHEKGVRLPIMAQVTVDQFGKMQIFNTDILSVMTTVQGIGIDVFGINCSIGPDLMRTTVQKIAANCPLPVSVIPNAGLPESENGKTVFKLTPEDMAQHLKEYVCEFGINIVGGCCGTTPAHISEIASTVRGLVPKKREVPRLVRVSGPQEAHVLDASTGLIRIGERLNVRGSQKVRQAVEGEEGINFHALEEVVEEQVKELGVTVIDVCMDSNLVDTAKTLVQVIQHVTTDFSGAMCLDSFSVEALLAAIEVYPGRPIINSISLEEYQKGLDKVDAVVPHTWAHDPLYVALCTGPEGPAATADDKFKLAKIIFEKCRDKYGIRADQLIVDVNAFPIGSESDETLNFALESLKAIPLIKSLHPHIMVSMGVGNLTNGLAKKPYMRQLLTSVFVDEARKRGMDAAIINPQHYLPVDSLDPEHVQLALKVILERDMEAFSELEDIAERRKGSGQVKRLTYDDLPLEQSICQKIRDGFKQRIKPQKIRVDDFVHEYVDQIVPQVAQALKIHKPLDFINQYLMSAMKELGDGFARGEVSLPHLLKSADVMKQAMGYIEAWLRHVSGVSVHDEIPYKGTVVLGTVFQDVHSIGKDLVKTLLENYGYRVIDLGVQTPLEKFVETAKLEKADAIGMSALLVQTSNHMITVAKMLKAAGLGHVDILIGGAPVNKRHAAYVAMCGQDNLAKMLRNVFYCPSGMDGVNVMNQLKESTERRDGMLKKNHEDLVWQYEHAIKKQAEMEELMRTLPRRQICLDGVKREQSQYVVPQKLSLTLADFKEHLDLKTLFSLNWRFGGESGWNKKGVTREDLESKLMSWVEICDAKKWIEPQGVFGVFPCRSHDDQVVIFDPVDLSRELARIPFNVVVGHDKKDLFSVAQYFLHGSDGRYDAIGLQITTGGAKVDEQIARFKSSDDTESAHFLQGLSDRVAEDMAEHVHQVLRARMQLGSREGARYSPGYPALKEIAVNRVLFDLLDAPEQLGIRLTDAGEFDPTGTTGAVVCFHPQAGYE